SARKATASGKYGRNHQKGTSRRSWPPPPFGAWRRGSSPKSCGTTSPSPHHFPIDVGATKGDSDVLDNSTSAGRNSDFLRRLPFCTSTNQGFFDSWVYAFLASCHGRVLRQKRSLRTTKNREPCPRLHRILFPCKNTDPRTAKAYKGRFSLFHASIARTSPQQVDWLPFGTRSFHMAEKRPKRP